jgi:collagenase-like PrtC family protease
MQLAVGYQQLEDGSLFSSVVADYVPKIGEVYFAWTGSASGRPVLGDNFGKIDWNSQHILEEELRKFVSMGLKLDLLFNANCYGERAISVSLEQEVISIIEHLGDIGCLPDIITTTSLMIARTVKKYFPDIEVRASVNMRIGTIQAMGYVSNLFDSFYIQRDHQRDIDYVKKVSNWCETNGKKLCILANSGCLRFCPGQVFHDNLIAHSRETEHMRNVPDWNPHVCWNLYRDPKNFVEILKSTWIRPEDLHLYDGIVDTVKLATRQHSHPRMVIGAYAEERFPGNLLDLLEPGFSSAFSPYFIDNTAFPSDWAKRISHCPNDCSNCSYCDQVIKKVLKSYNFENIIPSQVTNK